MAEARFQRPGLLPHLLKMQHGDQVTAESGGRKFTVHYHERQSLGDNGQPVRGATVGEYTVVDHKGGIASTHPHGPHAKTDAARRRGANPNAKGYAAQQAISKMMDTWARIGRGTPDPRLFNDRRSPYS